jgi:hypothetical protein
MQEVHSRLLDIKQMDGPVWGPGPRNPPGGAEAYRGVQRGRSGGQVR